MTSKPRTGFELPADGEEMDKAVAKMEAAAKVMRQAALKIQHDFQLTELELGSVYTHLALKTAFNPDPQEPLPTTAPELWAARDLNLRENAPAFTRRVYGKWLEHGLARRDIARLDSDLYKALSVWLARHPDDEIANQLPSQSEEIDRAIKHLSAQYPVEFLRKLGYAIDTRLRRQQK